MLLPRGQDGARTSSHAVRRLRSLRYAQRGAVRGANRGALVAAAGALAGALGGLLPLKQRGSSAADVAASLAPPAAAARPPPVAAPNAAPLAVAIDACCGGVSVAAMDLLYCLDTLKARKALKAPCSHPP